MKEAMGRHGIMTGVTEPFIEAITVSANPNTLVQRYITGFQIRRQDIEIVLTFSCFWQFFTATKIFHYFTFVFKSY
jgi:hypothetical protein